MNAGLRDLLWRGFLGGLRSRLLKLKEVKYWIGLLGLFLYFGLLVLPALVQKTKSPVDAGLGSVMFGSMLIFSMSLSWLFQGRRSGLGFTEAEIELLFPAPLTRRELLNYKLLKSQFGLFFSTMLVVFFSSLSWTYSSIIYTWFSFFLLFNLIHIHGLVAVLICQRLRGRWFSWPVRLGIAGLLLLPLFELYATFPVSVGQTEKLAFWGKQVADGALGGWMTKAWLFVGRLPFVQETGAVWLPLLAVLVLWVACYIAVLRLGVGFEENELAGAKARSETVKAVREGRLAPVKDQPVRAAWFKLGTSGPLWRALAWKNFTSATRHIPWSLFIILGVFSIQAVVLFIAIGDNSHMGLKLGSLCLGLAIFLSMMGSQFIREDLRSSLRNVDLIKSLPIPPLELIRGEIYGAASVILLGVYGLIGLFLLFVGGSASAKFPIVAALGFASITLFLFPGIILITFLIDNALALVFPSWVVSKDPGQEQNTGIEQIGRGVINMIVKMVGLFVFSLLPGLFAGMTWFLASIFLSKWLYPLGAVLFLFIAWIEVEMGMLWMANQFEALDPSTEDL